MGTASAYRISFNLLPTGFSKVYAYSNNNVIIKRNVNANLITNSIDVWDDENDTLRYRKLELEGLWENPEDVIGYYGITDNQDLELPFPEEMLNFVIAEILKTEFAIAPKDIEIDKK